MKGKEEKRGSHCGSLAEGRPAADIWTGTRGKHPLEFSGMAADVTGSSGQESLPSCHLESAHWPMVPGHPPLWKRSKPSQRVTCGWFSRIRRQQGISMTPGALPCHYVILLKASKIPFSVTQWRHPRKERNKQTNTKSRDMRDSKL